MTPSSYPCSLAIDISTLQDSVKWCGSSWLELSIDKTKEPIMTFLTQETSYPWPSPPSSRGSSPDCGGVQVLGDYLWQRAQVCQQHKGFKKLVSYRPPPTFCPLNFRGFPQDADNVAHAAGGRKSYPSSLRQCCCYSAQYLAIDFIFILLNVLKAAFMPF